MSSREYEVRLTWSEAMNLVAAAAKAQTGDWTPAAKGALRRAQEKVLAAVPTLNAGEYLLVIRAVELGAQPHQEPRAIDVPSESRR